VGYGLKFVFGNGPCSFIHDMLGHILPKSQGCVYVPWDFQLHYVTDNVLESSVVSVWALVAPACFED